MVTLENFLESIQDDALKVVNVNGSRIKVDPLKSRQVPPIEVESLEYLAQMIAEDLSGVANDNRDWEIYKTLLPDIFKIRNNLSIPDLGLELEESARFSRIAVKKFQEVHLAPETNVKSNEVEKMERQDIDYFVGCFGSQLNDEGFRIQVELSDAHLAHAIGKHMTEAMHHTINRPCHIMNEIYKSLVASIWQQESELTQEEVKLKLDRAVTFSYLAMCAYRDRANLI